MPTIKTKEFDRPQIGALRNTSGNGTIVRLFDFRLLHDLRLDELAAAKKLTWDSETPYMVIRYPLANDKLDSSGRISVFIPPSSFQVRTFKKWGLAEDNYVEECNSQTGKQRKQWSVVGNKDSVEQE